MSRLGWTLFAAMSLIWGVPYLFIHVAVEDLEPPVVVFGRTAIGATVLLVLAARSGAIGAALAHWRPVLAFAILEMAIPWILLTAAQQHLASGMTALIVSSVPLVGAAAAFLLGDRSALRPVRVAGIALGVGGVALLVAHDLASDTPPPLWSVAAVLVVAVCYGTAPFIVARRLSGVPSLGVISVCLATVAVIYAPLAVWSWPSSDPTRESVLSVVALGLLCTALAFVIFFRLIGTIGAARAGLITFVNPVVAITLGTLFLDESITMATVGGAVLVGAGCWFATRSAPVVAPVADRAPEPAAT